MLHFWFDALWRHNAKQHEFPRVGACWRCHSDQPTQLQHAPGIRPMTQNSMNFQCLAAVAHERRAICFVALCGTCRKHNEFKGFWRCWWIPVACWSHVGTPNGTANMRQHVRIQTFSAMRWKSGVAFLVRRIGCPQRETA